MGTRKLKQHAWLACGFCLSAAVQSGPEGLPHGTSAEAHPTGGAVTAAAPTLPEAQSVI